MIGWFLCWRGICRLVLLAQPGQSRWVRYSLGDWLLANSGGQDRVILNSVIMDRSYSRAGAD